MLPILISVLLAPASYLACTAGGFITFSGPLSAAANLMSGVTLPIWTGVSPTPLSDLVCTLSGAAVRPAIASASIDIDRIW